MIKHLLHQMNYAHAVSKSIVVCAGVGEVADPELMNSTQPLHFRTVKKLK